MASLQKRLPHWIHHTRVDESNVNGIVYLPKCDCSECGYTVSFEKPVCPHCHVKDECHLKRSNQRMEIHALLHDFFTIVV